MELSPTVRRSATSDFIAARSDKLETFPLPVCIYPAHRRPRGSPCLVICCHLEWPAKHFTAGVFIILSPTVERYTIWVLLSLAAGLSYLTWFGSRLPAITIKVSRAWIFPILSLGVGSGTFVYIFLFPRQFDSFSPLLHMWPAGHSLFGLGILALLAALFGFFRPKQREIWSYGLLMWAPQAVIYGGAWALGAGGLRNFELFIAVSALLAGFVAVVASYAGFALRKIANRFFAASEPPSCDVHK